MLHISRHKHVKHVNIVKQAAAMVLQLISLTTAGISIATMESVTLHLLN